MCISCVPSCQPHEYELHRKVRWLCKVSNSLKVLIQFYWMLLYTQLYATYRTVEYIDNAQLLYHGIV